MFAPPSRMPVELFFRLRKDSRTRKFMIGANLELLAYPPNRTVESRIRWYLEDRYPSRKQYYFDLFERMREIVKTLPRASGHDRFPVSVFGSKARAVSQILAKQQKLMPT